nr:hypothetical protein [Tanacetum cinerariifolium]
MWDNLPSDVMRFLTSLHAPWHVPWRPAVTGMIVEERRGKSAAITSHGLLPCPLVAPAGNCAYREGASGGATSYESTLEMFDSKSNKWTVMGPMPVEFAVRLTVCTPNESVYSNGVLYWMTSARAYSIMGYEMDKDKWKELGVPMGDTLEFATLVPRDGKVAVVGGTHDGNVLVWELGAGDEWILIMPLELAKIFAVSSTKCAGIEGEVCLYKDIASRMVVWRSLKNHKNKWEWCFIEGCNTVSGKKLKNHPFKGLFLHPNLAASPFV